MIGYSVRQSRLRHKGLTLVELLLALAATALISAAIATMLNAVSYGTDSAKDMRSLVGESKRISTRLSALIRISKAVLYADDEHLILWANDADESGTVSTQEIRFVEFDTDQQHLLVHQLKDVQDSIEIALDADFVGLENTQLSQGKFKTEIWSKMLLSSKVRLNQSMMQNADLITLQLRLERDDIADDVLVVERLRNRRQED